MKKSYIITLILFIISGFSVKAQISHGGQPLSFSVALNKKVSVFELPAFDYGKMIEEDQMQDRSDKTKPFRYGKTHEVNLTPENSGTWQTLDDGRKIWQLMINSEKAYSLSIISNRYKLNKNVSLFIFSPDRQQVIGSFTNENNLESGFFSTVPIAGSEIIVELDVSAGTDYGQFLVFEVVHDYKNILKSYGDSGPCNININCPDGANWQDEKRSVVKYTASGYLCSGALINNTAQDGKAYLLTANHCIGSSADASSALFWFNYESPGCTATVNPSHQSISSSSLKATGGNLDFTLVELSTVPPSNFNVYYSGWNRSSTPASHTVCIHHPEGDIKKITTDNDAPVIGDYNGGGYLTNSHWNILQWDKGTTEGGSSGSPLFDQNHRIVGDLTGGYASCSYDFNDYFSRFDLSWDYYSEASKQLKSWLDPLNTGAQYIDGLDMNALTTGTDAKIKEIDKPTSSFCGATSTTPQMVIINNGTVELTSLKLNYQVNGGSVVTENWTGSLTTSNSLIYTFSPALLPTGNGTFKAFISNPNGGNDLKHSNDTISIEYVAYQTIAVPEITGEEVVCNTSLVSDYSTPAQGTYLWNVTGGEITSGKGTNHVIVNWDKWGQRKIGLNVSNLCNSPDAVPIDVKVVEHGINLAIQTGDNASSICWNIKDCDGNLIYEGCGLPSNDLFTESLILAQGCYELNINTSGSSIAELSVSDFCGQNVLISGLNINGTYRQQFTIGDTNSSAEFNIYPNPAIDKFVIEASYSELYIDAKFTISNLRGSVVVPWQNLPERKEINVGNLPRGVYIVKIQSPILKFTRKIVKL
jgi:hypothetical protein